ncbi:unnamed protein product [Rotaria sp. Silwood2]|nr:unnamed protein product [Rotaria sp. Silwood2]CAF4549487.1 unnamed protein product [Rotaria sp. Silwood2]CAF4641831.1 unnamed protein product [Rotaria sp. Silwood2]
MQNNDSKQQTILNARRLKKVGRFKYDMLELSIAAGEEKIRNYDKKIKKEKLKLMSVTDKLKNNNSTSENFQQLMLAMEAREKHMMERADYITQQKLHSFFDEAPAPQQDIMNNDGVGANQN